MAKFKKDDSEFRPTIVEKPSVEYAEIEKVFAKKFKTEEQAKKEEEKKQKLAEKEMKKEEKKEKVTEG